MHRTLGSIGGVALALLAVTLPARAYETTVFDIPDKVYIHDLAPAPGGLVWFTAQRAGKLGILDPKTKSFRYVALGEGSAPHGVIQGPDGKAWITDGGLNAIVSYDPKTEALKVYKLPADTGYTNLNTPAVDGDGNVWFTGQTGIYGKVVVATGEVKVWNAPKGRGPYGITTTPDGNIWWSSLAGSYLAQVVNRETGEIKVIEPATPGAGLRRVWSDSKGDLWVSEWNTGKVSRYSPASGQWKSWSVPGNHSRSYAVYVDDKDVVWVSNWDSNTVYAFDPKTEAFTAVPGSGPKAEVRQMLGAPGELWLPESGEARIVRVNTGSNLTR